MRPPTVAARVVGLWRPGGAAFGQPLTYADVTRILDSARVRAALDILVGVGFLSKEGRPVVYAPQYSITAPVLPFGWYYTPTHHIAAPDGRRYAYRWVGGLLVTPARRLDLPYIPIEDVTR